MAAPAIALLFLGIVGRAGVRFAAGGAKAGAAGVNRAWRASSRKLWLTAVRGGRKGVRAAGEDLKKRAAAIAPVDTGELQRSARTDHLGNLREIVSVVSFGAGSKAGGYAFTVHENRANLGRGAGSNGGTEDGKVGPKYLERPFNRHKDRYVQEIGEAVLDEIRGGG